MRSQLDCNQQELADFCGIKREIISYYENGAREVSLLHLEKIVDFFGVSLESFVSNEISEMHPDFDLAFRAEKLSASDRKEISNFKMIVGNYLKMRQIDAHGIEA